MGSSLASIGRSWKVFVIVLVGTIFSIVMGQHIRGTPSTTPIFLGTFWLILLLWGGWKCHLIEERRVRSRSRLALASLIVLDVVFLVLYLNIVHKPPFAE
jgi:hypothetical protein